MLPKAELIKEPPAPTFTPRVLPLLSLVDASAVIFIVPLFVAMPPLLTTIAVLIPSGAKAFLNGRILITPLLMAEEPLLPATIPSAWRAYLSLLSQTKSVPSLTMVLF